MYNCPNCNPVYLRAQNRSWTWFSQHTWLSHRRPRARSIWNSGLTKNVHKCSFTWDVASSGIIKVCWCGWGEQSTPEISCQSSVPMVIHNATQLLMQNSRWDCTAVDARVSVSLQWLQPYIVAQHRRRKLFHHGGVPTIILNSRTSNCSTFLAWEYNLLATAMWVLCINFMISLWQLSHVKELYKCKSWPVPITITKILSPSFIFCYKVPHNFVNDYPFLVNV